MFEYKTNLDIELDDTDLINELGDDVVTIEVVVKVLNYTPAVKGRYFYLPEDCYPDESASIDYEISIVDARFDKYIDQVDNDDLYEKC